MNYKLKSLLVFAGTALFAMPAAHAQRAGGGARNGGGFAAHPSFADRSALSSRSSFAGHSAFGARPAANTRSLGNGVNRGGAVRSNSRPVRGSGYYGRGGYHHGGHHYGRYYYLGGVPYFYPFYGYGYGFGYPGYYGAGFYGDGFYGGAGSEGNGDADRAYEGRVTSRNGDTGKSGSVNDSLPTAVQRQLAKRGYYKGSIDGQFGPASRDALSRFQKSQDIKPTGRIDEDTLDALGFTDEH